MEMLLMGLCATVCARPFVRDRIDIRSGSCVRKAWGCDAFGFVRSGNP
jgi:hypothetical protein